jgi:hypothetical protein
MFRPHTDINNMPWGYHPISVINKAKYMPILTIKSLLPRVNGRMMTYWQLGIYLIHINNHTRRKIKIISRKQQLFLSRNSVAIWYTKRCIFIYQFLNWKSKRQFSIILNALTQINCQHIRWSNFTGVVHRIHPPHWSLSWEAPSKPQKVYWHKKRLN